MRFAWEFNLRDALKSNGCKKAWIKWCKSRFFFARSTILYLQNRRKKKNFISTKRASRRSRVCWLCLIMSNHVSHRSMNGGFPIVHWPRGVHFESHSLWCIHAFVFNLICSLWEARVNDFKIRTWLSRETTIDIELISNFLPIIHGNKCDILIEKSGSVLASGDDYTFDVFVHVKRQFITLRNEFEIRISG